jgi:hypothetical protein
MAYAVDGLIEASDFNTRRAQVDLIYSNTSPAGTTQAIAGFGYGQTPAIPGPVAVGNPVLASEWNALLRAIEVCAEHQGSTIVDLPPITAATTPIEFLPTLDAHITTITNGKFIIGPGVGAVAGIATTSLGGNWDATRTQTVTATFGSWNEMRYFFNAGGKTRFSFSLSGTPTPGNATEANWVGMSAAIGQVSLDYTETLSSGGVGTSTVGFYDLTTSNQTIFSYVPDGYTSEQYLIQARLNAAPGSATSIIFTISFVTPPGGDIIDLTLVSERSIYSPNDVLTIAVPTLSATAIS